MGTLCYHSIVLTFSGHLPGGTVRAVRASSIKVIDFCLISLSEPEDERF